MINIFIAQIPCEYDQIRVIIKIDAAVSVSTACVMYFDMQM